MKEDTAIGSRTLLGERVKERRLELGFTQSKAAELAEMSQQEWNRLERVGPHSVELATALSVAKALSLVVDELEGTEAEEPDAEFDDGAAHLEKKT